MASYTDHIQASAPEGSMWHPAT